MELDNPEKIHHPRKWPYSGEIIIKALCRATNCKKIVPSLRSKSSKSNHSDNVSSPDVMQPQILASDPEETKSSSRKLRDTLWLHEWHDSGTFTLWLTQNKFYWLINAPIPVLMMTPFYSSSHQHWTYISYLKPTTNTSMKKSDLCL